MRKTLAGAVVVACTMTGVAFSAPANAAPEKINPRSVGALHAGCGTPGPNLENRVEADAPSGGAANQRTGSSTGCPVSGVLQPTDDARYFCYTVNRNDGSTWTYLQNIRTGVRGWVRDNLLDANGSTEYCGF